MCSDKKVLFKKLNFLEKKTPYSLLSVNKKDLCFCKNTNLFVFDARVL